MVSCKILKIQKFNFLTSCWQAMLLAGKILNFQQSPAVKIILALCLVIFGSRFLNLQSHCISVPLTKVNDNIPTSRTGIINHNSIV